MKTTPIRGVAMLAAVAGLMATGLVCPTPAAAQTVERPLSDFLDAQGTFDFFGILFVPPVPNFLGSNDPAADLGMSVDYAGLADAACGGIAGTTFAGEVKETELPDGRALVSVELRTSNAITWVIDGEEGTFDFAAGPVLFGTRWTDEGGVCVFDKPPTLGESELNTTFIIPEPGAPLPDSIALAVVALGLGDAFPDQIPEGLELLTFDFEATAQGELAGGTPAKAETKQVSEVIDGVWTFSQETVELSAN
jgi:hypothetical protein